MTIDPYLRAGIAALGFAVFAILAIFALVVVDRRHRRASQIERTRLRYAAVRRTRRLLRRPLVANRPEASPPFYH